MPKNKRIEDLERAAGGGGPDGDELVKVITMNDEITVTYRPKTKDDEDGVTINWDE